MKAKLINGKKYLLKIVLVSLLSVTAILGSIANSKSVYCVHPDIQAAMDRYDMLHPEIAKMTRNTPESAATAYAIAMQTAIQINGGSTQGIVPTMDQNTYVKKTLQTQAANYQKSILMLQTEYQKAIAVGNLTYAQQCVNCANQYGALLAQTNAQLATLP